jgi:uncharacterized protein YdiU (UPF0061 family)
MGLRHTPEKANTVLRIPFDNRYVALGDRFSVKTKPVPVSKPGLIRFNEVLARDLGFSASATDPADVAAVFAGNHVPDSAEPVAMAYAGHQFGHFVPQLGDGRAILLGEITMNDDRTVGMHLKGSGRTHFSRNGDGRAALGPVLREYLVSEAMHALNVPTTRALAAVTTGEPVVREEILPGAVITRVARSFVRVGTFEYFAARGDLDSVRQLADHVISQNYPAAADSDQPYVELLKAVISRQARLIAQWMHIGFIHGVMNTDNMSVAGETIDFGPCAFMDAFDHNQVYSSIDQQGRYAYANQPPIGLWNLTRLAECLVPLFGDDTDAGVDVAKSLLADFVDQYESTWLTGMRHKCGLTVQPDTDRRDRALVNDLLDTMAAGHADFTLTFRHLSELGAEPGPADQSMRRLFDPPARFDAWIAEWRQRLALETRTESERQAVMRAVNPAYIPRNHQVEAAIRAAEDHGDFSVFHELHGVLQQPFEEQPDKARYQVPPAPEEVVRHTFCGT